MSIRPKLDILHLKEILIAAQVVSSKTFWTFVSFNFKSNTQQSIVKCEAIFISKLLRPKLHYVTDETLIQIVKKYEANRTLSCFQLYAYIFE